jgi:uncharacterized protein (TIGR02996 family)
MHPEEAAFQAALDANPDDHVTRIVFADWLQDHDDPRAEGYRELGRRGMRPVKFPTFVEYNEAGEPITRGRWFWWNESALWPTPAPGGCEPCNGLPKWWFDLIPWDIRNGNPDYWKGYTPTRAEAEDMAALAYSARPAELLISPARAK